MSSPDPAPILAADGAEAPRDPHRVRLARLQEATSAFSRASTPDEIASAAVRVGASAVDASASALWVVEDDGGLHLAAAHGIAAALEHEWTDIAADSDVPARRALDALEPLWVTGEEEYERLDATMAERARAPGRSTAFAALPLVLDGRPFGVLAFAFGVRHAFADDEKSFAVTLAQQCAQALERARLLESERAANARLAVLARAGELLTQSLDYNATLRAVTRAAVPSFADWACVDLIERSAIKRVAISHRDPAKVRLGEEVARRFPERLDAEHGIARAIRSGRAVVARRLDERGIDAAAVDAEHAKILRTLGLLSAMIIPVAVSGRTIGALSLVTTADSGRLYDDRDLELALELSRRTGVALSNANLYAREQAASRRAEDANRIKDDFLATVSHELRTPLNAILGWSTLLLGPKAGDAAAAAKGLEAIRRNAQVQAKLVEDILDVSRIITGKLKIDPIPVDLTSIAREAMEVVRPSVDAKGVSLELDPAAEPVLLVGDPSRLQQVVWNLLSNAAKFTEPGGSIRVVVERVGAQAKLVVRDTGRGIPPELLPHVFERFRQGDSSTTRSFGGLGLGLAIVRHIVELHGGRVRADSAGLDRGSTFSVKLPDQSCRAWIAAGLGPDWLDREVRRRSRAPPRPRPDPRRR